MSLIPRQFFLIAGILLVLCSIFLGVLPRLDGVEKGVYVKFRTKDNKIVEKYISLRSPGFVKSEKLPKHVYGAIITAEDEDFYRHNGVSWDEIIHAVKYDIEHRALIAGGSTITQQVVKNVYLTRKKTLARKMVEAVTAVRLEKRISKRQILDYYLNIIEFGRGVYGIRQAANVYFD
jgi:membrane peptidoglycan carboxypeptidase